VKHPRRWLLWGIVVALVAVFGFGVWYVFGGGTPARPTLDTSTPVQASGPASPTGAWKVVAGKETYVGYRISETFTGDIVHKTAVGRTPSVTGLMTIAGHEVTRAVVVAQMQQLSSDRSARDNYIHTHGIDSDKYPTARFTLSSPITLPAAPVKGVPIHVVAKGILLLHGVTRPVSVPLDARWTGATIQVVGSVPIVLADYHITPPDTGVVRADGAGTFELSLTFVPA